MPVVYIDVVFVVNVVMDAVLLWTTGWIAKRAFRVRPVLLGALIGAVYALILFVPALTVLTSWPGKVIVSLLMVVTAYPTRNWLETFRLTLLYYFVSFVFAGATIALHFAIPGTSVENGLVLTNQRYAMTTSFQGLALVVAIPVGFTLLRYTFQRVRQIRVQSGALLRVAASMQEKRVEFVGLLDTGNHLREPISGKPVCLVEAGALKPLLPSELQRVVDEGRDIIQGLSSVTDPNWSSRVALVPFQGAGGVRRITMGIRPEKLEVWRENSWHAVAGECFLAVHAEKLSLDNRFQAILHTDVTTGDEGFESKLTTTSSEHEVTHTSSTAVDSHPRDPGWRL